MDMIWIMQTLKAVFLRRFRKGWNSNITAWQASLRHLKAPKAPTRALASPCTCFWKEASPYAAWSS